MLITSIAFEDVGWVSSRRRGGSGSRYWRGARATRERRHRRRFLRCAGKRSGGHANAGQLRNDSAILAEALHLAVMTTQERGNPVGYAFVRLHLHDSPIGCE